MVAQTYVILAFGSLHCSWAQSNDLSF